MNESSLQELLGTQREYYRSGATRSVTFRLEMLDRLHRTLRRREAELFEALRRDLGKSPFESYLSEVGMTYEELKLFRKKLAGWMAAKRAAIAMANWPARGRILPEPYGQTLIFSAWNYPLQLALNPLIGALGAGNCAILKPSELAPATAEVLASVIREALPPELVSVVSGGPETGEMLLRQPFDFIFFTGSPRLGKIIYRAAAEHLTPVVLELGGKSPCLVAADADLDIAARRIVWGKFLNAGQTCVAPDYVLVDRRAEAPLLEQLRERIGRFFGSDPGQSPDYPRIISDRHFDRLLGLLNGGRIYCGGRSDRAQRYLEPTVLTDVDPESPVMQEEIFGPILPVLSVDGLEAAIEFVNRREKPLALYYFSRDRRSWQTVADRTSSGSLAINDTVAHLANPAMPFGGVGNSGIGAYHGASSFAAFSHFKPVMSKPTFPDLPLRYPPYRGHLRFLRWFLG